jgi:hypothetical protein
MKAFVVVFLTFIAASTAFGLNNDGSKPQILDLPDTQLRVHHASNILFSVTNFGFIGSQDGAFHDVEGLFNPAPGAEFPAYSGLEHLFQGAIWIGATVDTIINGIPTLDTLVSIGNDGWWGQLFELFPPPAPYQSMWRDRITGDEEIFATYEDTVTDPRYVVPDPNDGRPHIPLGIKITQNSICWSSRGFNEIFIINFYIENLCNRPLHDVWIGLYYDGDVYYISENPYGMEQGAQDDICGFHEDSGGGVAWIADNDGQPYNGQFDYRSSTRLMAMTVLKPTGSGIQNNFNWWISNINASLDWGPQLQSNYHGPFPGGGNGTPGGDKAKYQVMSNGEHDYDQAYCAVQHPGWINPPSTAVDLANGYDTRYLLSCGPMRIQPFGVETLTVAYFGVNHFHIDPYNYANNLHGHELDTVSINRYYANLDFSDLIAKADSARSYFAHDYSQVPIGPPANFRITGWGENEIRIAWSPTWFSNLAEYRIYRGTQPGIYDPVKITPDNFRDTIFIDTGRQINVRYYYVITTVKNTGAEGGYSNEISVNTGQPQTPSGLVVSRGNAQVTLDWNANPDSDIAGYIIYRAEHSRPLSAIDSVNSLTYTDNNLRNGLEYDYAISAYDQGGRESFLSNTVIVIPMGLDHGILLVDANRTNPNYNPDHDSMTAFYNRALAGFDTFTWINTVPDSLTDIADYKAIIWSKETTIPGNMSYYQQTWGTLLAEYLDNGGTFLSVGTRNIIGNPTFEDTINYLPVDFCYRYFNLAGAEYPSWNTNTEFIGGHSNRSGFADFDVDTSRANRIVFPPEENFGRLFGIGALIPNDTSEVIYTYRAVNPDTSHFDGRPIGLIHHGNGFEAAVLEFPLYYATEPASFDILHTLLDSMHVSVINGDDHGVILPKTPKLLQNYPNPFNAQTSIQYWLAKKTSVKVLIYNILGQRMATLEPGIQTSGLHNLIWDARDLSSGIYFARLETGDYAKSIKMVLLR